jgi:hypothetical protein
MRGKIERDGAADASRGAGNENGLAGASGMRAAMIAAREASASGVAAPRANVGVRTHRHNFAVEIEGSA